MFLFNLFAREHTIHLYEGGLCKQGDDKNCELPWEEIHRVLVREFSSSAGTLCVTVLGRDKTRLNFTTEFEGAPGEIIDAIKDKIEDVEYEYVR